MVYTPPSAPSESAIDVEIPSSSVTVDVRAIDTGTRLYLKPGMFWEPILDRFEGPNAPVFCFLVSRGNRHVVFDLGVRIDWESYAPSIVRMIKASTKVLSCTKDVVSVLDEDTSGFGVRSTDIEAVIWSHSHFDHAGDPSRFPLNTELIVGPGISPSTWPGYPSNPDGTLLDSDIAGRKVREIVFSGLKVGGFEAFDYFGDGSFYLLDAPGHQQGHMCALARTTADPASFVFMGADACHHPGVVRPTQQVPLSKPELITTNNLGMAECPGDLLARLMQWQDPHRPFFNVAPGPLFPNPAAAAETVAKIQKLDALEEVFVILAHDTSLCSHLPLFPSLLNGWQAQKLSETTKWLFCREFRHVTHR